jgi:hypothetical protein
MQRLYMGGNPRGEARRTSPHRGSLTRGYANPAFHAGRQGGFETRPRYGDKPTRRQGGFETRPYAVVR